MRGMKRQRGVGLVELMIGLVIGLLLIAMAAEIFLTSRQSFALQQASSELQQSGRYASFRMMPPLRNIGYAGCSRHWNVTDHTGEVDLAGEPLSIDYDNIGGVEYAHLTFYSAVIPAGGVAYVDEPMSNATTIKVEPIYSTGVSLETSGGDPLLLISDCDQGEIFSVESLGSSLTSNQSLEELYGQIGAAVASVYPLRKTEIYVALSPSSSRLALYLRENDETGQAIVDGVSGFSVRVGIDDDNDGAVDRFISDPEDDTDWGKVRSLALTLTLTSETPVSGNDGQLSQPYIIAVAIRNAL